LSDPADLSLNQPDPFASGADALRVEGLGSANGSTAATVTAGTNGTTSLDDAGALNGGANGDGAVNGERAAVIDLREAGTTRVRVAKDNNPFGALSKQERMRLIVRVLCEIVAYGELDEGTAEDLDPEASAAVDAPAPPPATDLPVSNN